MKFLPTMVLLAGALPVLAVHLAFGLNIQAGLEGCNPYWEGCISVSRAVRSGPGLLWFKILALPAAIFMVLAWMHVPSLRSWPRRLGVIGAAFFLVYAAALGTDGDFYGWMRRYGVVFYFGMTGLAQLLLARAWLNRQPRPRRLGVYLAVLVLTWAAGIGSALKRTLIENPVVINRVENVLEWWFALGLSLAFLAIAAVIRRE